MLARTALAVVLSPVKPVNSIAPVASGIPTIGGSPAFATSGEWLNAPAGITYLWLLEGFSQPGNPFTMTSPTYIPDATDFGQNLFCVVTATNARGSAFVFTNLVGPVGA